MSKEDISAEDYRIDEYGNRFVSNKYSIPVSTYYVARGPNDLPSVMNRLKKETYVFNRRPEFTLQSSDWYKVVNGVPTKRELRRVIKECLGCKATPIEISVVWNAFQARLPNDEIGFDFRAFTAALTAPETDRRKYTAPMFRASLSQTGTPVHPRYIQTAPLYSATASRGDGGSLHISHKPSPWSNSFRPTYVLPKPRIRRTKAGPPEAAWQSPTNIGDWTYHRQPGHKTLGSW